jgi:hypothetical protein
MPMQQSYAPPDDVSASGHHAFDATRRMCAGAYLDHGYREQLLRQVYLDRSRHVAPSYGFDAVPVLAHVRSASVLDGLQHLTMAAVAAIWVILDPVPATVAACVLITWYVIRVAYKVLTDYLRYFATRGSVADSRHLARRRNLLLPTLIAPWAVVWFATFTMRHADYDAALTHPRVFLIHTLRALLSVALVVVVFAMMRQALFARIPSQPAMAARAGSRLHTIAVEQWKPFTVYAGDRPFIGAGVQVRTWSFAQRIDRVADIAQYGTQPDEIPVQRRPLHDEPLFRTADLAEFVARQIKALRYDNDAELRLPNLTVGDHGFIGGGRAERLQRHDDDDEVIGQLRDDPGLPDRYYLACRVTSWHGEIVTTVFVHTAIQGNTLYLEFSTFALPPVRRRYQAIDDSMARGALAMVRAAARSVWRIPDEAARVPHGLGVFLSWPFTFLRPGYERAMFLGRNVGARFSIREYAADIMTDNYNWSDALPRINYFQARDIVKYIKVIERRLLSAVGDFLVRSGIETTEYTQRTLAILNQGIMITGSGSPNAAGTAVGQGAVAEKL